MDWSYLFARGKVVGQLHGAIEHLLRNTEPARTHCGPRMEAYSGFEFVEKDNVIKRILGWRAGLDALPYAVHLIKLDDLALFDEVLCKYFVVVRHDNGMRALVFELFEVEHNGCEESAAVDCIGSFAKLVNEQQAARGALV